MRTATKLTDENRAEIVQRYGAGERIYTIAQDFAVSTSTISDVAREGGCEPRHKNRQRNGSPDRLTDGAWIYGADGVARWTPGAVAPYLEGAAS